jgi:hypothetical protein
MSALVTEHFVLQSQAATATSESGTRASLYLLSLSSGLVAMGFAAQASPHAFHVFAAGVLPALCLIGWFTVVRLVDTSIANVMCLRRIARIRRYYASLLPDADHYFPQSGGDEQDSLVMLGARRSGLMLWFTLASMVGVVNAMVAGTSIAVLLDAGLNLDGAVSVAVGIVVAVAAAVLVVVYERRRFRTAFAE